MKWKGADGGKMIILGKVLNLAIPRGGTMVGPNWEKFTIMGP